MSSLVRPLFRRPLLPLARMAAWAGRRGAATILAVLVGGSVLPDWAPSARADEAPAGPSRGAGVSD